MPDFTDEQLEDIREAIGWDDTRADVNNDNETITDILSAALAQKVVAIPREPISDDDLGRMRNHAISAQFYHDEHHQHGYSKHGCPDRACELARHVLDLLERLAAERKPESDEDDALAGRLADFFTFTKRRRAFVHDRADHMEVYLAEDIDQYFGDVRGLVEASEGPSAAANAIKKAAISEAGAHGALIAEAEAYGARYGIESGCILWKLVAALKSPEGWRSRTVSDEEYRQLKSLLSNSSSPFYVLIALGLHRSAPKPQDEAKT